MAPAVLDGWFQHSRTGAAWQTCCATVAGFRGTDALAAMGAIFAVICEQLGRKGTAYLEMCDRQKQCRHCS